MKPRAKSEDRKIRLASASLSNEVRLLLLFVAVRVHLTRITPSIGELSEGENWNIYGGLAFDRGRLSIKPVDSSSCRLEGFACPGAVEIGDPNSLRRGLWFEDPATERKIQICFVDCNKGTPEGLVFRRIRIFSPYVFLDRSNLQLKLSEDTVASVTSYPQANTGDVTTTKLLFSSHYPELDRQFVYLSSPGTAAWTPPINFASALLPVPPVEAVESIAGAAGANSSTNSTKVHVQSQSEGQAGLSEVVQMGTDGSGDGERFCIVRVPVKTSFAPTATEVSSNEQESLRHVYAEIVVSLVKTSLAVKPGPKVFALTPRLTIVNQLGCAVGLRRLDVLPFRGSGERDYELPMFVPSGTAAPFLFWESASNESIVDALELNSLSFMPVFTPAAAEQRIDVWEWSHPVSLRRAADAIMLSFHNVTLDRRMLTKVQIKVDGPHTTVVLSNYGATQVPIKIQNQTSRCAIRFSQKVYDPVPST